MDRRDERRDEHESDDYQQFVEEYRERRAPRRNRKDTYSHEDIDGGTVQDCDKCGLAFHSTWDPERIINDYTPTNVPRERPKQFICELCEIRGLFTRNIEHLWEQGII